MPRESTEALARRRMLAAAYARKNGMDMVPPSARRPIVTAEEIAANVARVGEDATPESGIDTGRLLNSRASAQYLGVGRTTFRNWVKDHGLPVAVGVRAKGQQSFYRVTDLEDLRARAEEAMLAALAPSPTQMVKTSESTAPRVHPKVAARDRRLAQLEAALAEGLSVDAAAGRASYSSVQTALQAATRAGRTELAEQLRRKPSTGKPPAGKLSTEERAQRMAAGRAASIETRKQKALDRVATLERALRAGTTPEDAATAAGYVSIIQARKACTTAGRPEVLELLPDRRGHGKRAAVETRRAELRRLLDEEGLTLAEASIRVGYSHVNSARRALAQATPEVLERAA